MTHQLHPQVAILLSQYAQELKDTSPSDDLDARIGAMVALPAPANIQRPRRWSRAHTWAAAASVAVLAITIGIFIGVKLERGARFAKLSADSAWPPADFSMWPTDSVALQIPAEYSAQGTLVAVDPSAHSSGKRYWIDVVVSNDGTVRIEKIVPAEPANNSKKGSHDGITLQSQ
jgi:hypothetical protein